MIEKTLPAIHRVQNYTGYGEGLMYPVSHSIWRNNPLKTGADISRYYIGELKGDEWSLNRSVKSLNRYKANEESVTDAVSTAYNYRGWGRYYTLMPQQYKSEITEAMLRIADMEPETVVELGTATGGSFYPMTRITSVKRAISVDLPKSHPRRGVSALYDNRKLFNRFDDETQVGNIRGNVFDERVFDTLQKKIGSTDILFIDADDSYEGMLQIYDQYKDLVNSGGIIGLHDVTNPDEGGPEAWAEIKDDYESEVISNGGYGIGLLYT